jgi:hypothetical protein
MLTVYAQWLEGAGKEHIADINAAMEGGPATLRAQIESNRACLLEALPVPSGPHSLPVGRQYDIVLARKCLKRKRKGAKL